jgi:hypothetical protein
VPSEDRAPPLNLTFRYFYFFTSLSIYHLSLSPILSKLPFFLLAF